MCVGHLQSGQGRPKPERGQHRSMGWSLGLRTGEGQRNSIILHLCFLAVTRLASTSHSCRHDACASVHYILPYTVNQNKLLLPCYFCKAFDHINGKVINKSSSLLLIPAKYEGEKLYSARTYLISQAVAVHAYCSPVSGFIFLFTKIGSLTFLPKRLIIRTC